MNPVLLIFLQIFCYDIWFYVSHILLHHQLLYAKIHALHHLKSHQLLVYLDAYTGHYAESLVQSAGLFIPYVMIDVPIKYLFIAGFITNLRGLLRHDPRFSWLIGNHHLLHHKYQKYNFGEYWLDCAFGTMCPHKGEYIFGQIYT